MRWWRRPWFRRLRRFGDLTEPPLTEVERQQQRYYPRTEVRRSQRNGIGNLPRHGR